MIQALIAVAFPLLAIYAAMTDMLAKTIPNRVSILAIVLFPVAAIGAGMPVTDIALSFGAGLSVFLVLYLGPYSFGWMAGGDVKFAAVAALWLGWAHLYEFSLYFSIYGGLLTVATLVLANHARHFPALQLGFLADLDTRTVPYGVALAAAAVQLYPESAIFGLII